MITSTKIYFVIAFWLFSRLIRISPFANRLSADSYPSVQRLRCLANYEAMRFSDPIATFSKNLVNRMKETSIKSNGNYIAVHLRFEEVSFFVTCF